MRISLAVLTIVFICGCGPGSPRDETKDLAFTRGMGVNRDKTDIGGDDAGYFTIFGVDRPFAEVLRDAKLELTEAKGWRIESSTDTEHRFIRTVGDIRFKVGVLKVKDNRTVVGVTQLVPEDKM